MGDWIHADPEDIFSQFTQKSRTPLHRKSFNVSGLAELNFSPSPKKALDFDSAFCSKENLDQCIAYLDQELTVVGFPSMFNLECDTFDIVLMVNNMNEMLKLYRKTARQKESLENLKQRSDSDLVHLQQGTCHLRENISQLQKERNACLEKERPTSNKLNTLSNKFRVEKEEVKRLKSVIQHQDAQFKHELKRKERECNKLKERVHSVISDRNQEKRFTMEISHPVQRSDGRRGTWKTNNNKHEEEMYNLVINSYEEKVQNFMVENHQLRECLKDLRHELKAVLQSNPSTPSKYHSTARMSELSSIAGDDADSVKSAGSDDAISEGHFQMPFDTVGEGIERSIKHKLEQIKARIQEKYTNGNKETSGDSSASPEQQDQEDQQDKLKQGSEENLAELHDKIAHYKDIIEQQESLIKSMSSNQTFENTPTPTATKSQMPFLNDSALLEDKRNLEDQMKIFQEQKENFEQERKTFTDAAIRLGMERKVFEQDRANAMAQELLQTTPFADKTPIPVSRERSQSVPESPSLKQPSVMSFSPAPRRNQAFDNVTNVQFRTPSTGELYRSIGLRKGSDSVFVNPEVKRKL